MPFDLSSPFASGSAGKSPSGADDPFPTFGPPLRWVAGLCPPFLAWVASGCAQIIRDLIVQAVGRVRSSPMTLSFVAINLGLFLITSALGGDEGVDSIFRAMGVTHVQVLEWDWWRIFTSGWTHSSWDHVASNCTWLIIWGCLLEPAIGSSKFALLHLLAVLGSGFAAFLLQTGNSGGASGAVYGLAAAILICPAFTSGTGVLAWLLALRDVVEGIMYREATSIGYACHFGGMLTGLMVGAFLASRGGLPGLAPRWVRVPVAAIAAVTVVITLANDPRWALEWDVNRAYNAMVHGQRTEATARWARIERDANPDRRIEAQLLCEAAMFRNHVLDDSLGARAMLARVAPKARLPEAYAELAYLQACRQPCDDQAAMKSYEAAFALDSSQVETRYEMAQLYIFTSDSTLFDPQRALAQVRAAPPDDPPPSPHHLRVLAWVHLACGERAEALRRMKQALGSGAETPNLFRAELRAMKESPSKEGRAWTYTAWERFSTNVFATTAAITD